MAKHASKGAKPRITLTATDHERLSRLMLAASNTMPDLAADLAEELDRAHVLPAGRPANGIVCMGCEVEFRDDTTGRIQTVTLAFPDEADIAKGKISILTPIGVALIGLAIEKSISWETRRGDVRRLTVLSVREPQHTEMPPVADPSAVAPGAEAHPA